MRRPLARALRASLLVSGGGLRGLRAVRSRERFGATLEGLVDGLYFVSTDLDGAGLAGPDDLATWAVDAAAFERASGIVVAADATARRHSRLGADVELEAVGITEETHGFSASRTCADRVARASAQREAQELARATSAP